MKSSIILHFITASLILLTTSPQDVLGYPRLVEPGVNEAERWPVVLQKPWYRFNLTPYGRYAMNDGPGYTTWYKATLQYVLWKSHAGYLDVLEPMVNQPYGLKLNNGDIRIRGRTNNPADTVINFTGEDWIIGGSFIGTTFEHITFTGIKKPLDVSHFSINFHNCVFKTDVTTPVFIKTDPLGGVTKRDAYGKGGHTTFTLTGSTFINEDPSPPLASEATHDGGFLNFSLDSTDINMRNNKFIGGRARNGGCVHLKTTGGKSPAKLQVVGNIFLNCIAQNGGGAYIAIENIHAQSYVAITSSNFESCKATANGGGMYLANIPQVDDATDPTIDYRAKSLIVRDTTFDSNMAVNGGGLYMASTAVSRLHADSTKYIKFVNNKAYKFGGGLYIADSGAAKQHIAGDLIFHSNSAGVQEVKAPLQSLTTMPLGELSAEDGQGGAIYSQYTISSHPSATDPLGVDIAFKFNSSTPNLKKNTAKFGGAIASSGIINLYNIYSEANVASGKGGALLLQDKSSIHSSRFASDEATGAGGCIAFVDGHVAARFSLTLSDVVIQGASSGAQGGGIYASGNVHSVTLSPAQIVSCSSTNEGPAVYFSTSRAQGQLYLGDGSLIYGNAHANQAAVYATSTVNDWMVNSNDVEYRENSGGHITLDSTFTGALTVTGDYYDDSSVVSSTPSVTIKGSISKSFTSTYFKGTCPNTQGAGANTVVVQCNPTSALLYYSGGMWGPTPQCTLAGDACQAITSSCTDTNACPSGMTERATKVYDALRDIVPALAPTTTTTTTTTTTPVPTTPPSVQVCYGPNSRSRFTAYSPFVIGSEEKCEERGMCWTWGRCRRPDASGQDVMTPGTTCNQHPEDRKVAGPSRVNRDECVNKYGACWILPPPGTPPTSTIPSCFEPDKRLASR